MTLTLPDSEALQLKMEILHPEYLKELSQIHREVQRRIRSNAKSNDVTPVSYGSLRVKNNSNAAPSSPSDQAKIRSSSTLPKMSHEKHKGTVSEVTEKKRKNMKYTFDEMIHFEHRFIESLRILKTITEEINSSPTLKENLGLREVFKDIPSLFHLHEHICKSLDELEPENSGEILPAVFVDDKEIPFLNIYKSFMCRYVVNYPSLANYYNKDKEFASICWKIVQTSKYEEQKIQDVCGMYFGVHCSLARFRLLITKLEESLNPDDKRMPSVKKALNVLTDILQVSEGEVVRQDRISDAQVAFAKMDGRELNFRHIPPLLREGACKKIPRRSTHKRNLDRHLFLFSGYLVITEPANAMGRYQVKSELVLAGMNLYEVSADDEISTPHCFRIKAKELCVELAFSNEAEKSDWWDAIQSAINNERGRNDSIVPVTPHSEQTGGHGTSAAEWVKDEQSTMCAECFAEFTMLNRRHHCRACGKLFCGSCSAYRAPIAFLGGKVKRVCVIDYYLIHSNLKPPTTAIMEGILRRTQKESASIESGYLYWCQYSQGTWNAKPTTRPAKFNSPHKYMALNLSRSGDLTPLSPVFFTINADNEFKNRSTEEKTPTKSNAHPVGPQNVLKNASFELTSNDSNCTAVTPRTRSPSCIPNPTICLCRVYTVLQLDTLLSMYAARADTRAKDQLPLLGTRLFYLEHVAKAEQFPPRGRVRSSSCVSPNHSGNDSHDNNNNNNDNTNNNACGAINIHISATQSSSSSLNSVLSQTSLNSKPESPNAPSDSSENNSNNNCPITPSQIKMGNPLYRNRKPPALPPKPQHLSEIANLRVGRISGKLESQTTAAEPPLSPKSSSVSFSQAETLKQLNSISPTVLAVLQNDLGFLLLPMNTDCLAYYFEAPSYEVRTKWINSIRQACIDYLSK